MEAETMKTKRQSDVSNRLLLALLPALLISVGYVDPGKWVATIDGGARFGNDLVALMFLFNLAAILCQYLSARIGIVTGKNLAQICSDEYDKYTCIFLGVQAELSVIALDLTMVLGIAHGLNLLFGVDLSTGVFLAAFDAVLFPVFATLLEYWKTNVLCMCLVGFVLLSYAFGVLVSQPEISLSMNGVLTRLNGESAFVLMSLLGANIMPHNFYLHSSIVQQYQRPTNISKSALCHDHFFGILCLFSGIYLVNYVLMNSAANVFHSSGFVLLTFQDALSLVEQAFRNAVLASAFLLVMFLSNQITASIWNLSGQVVLHDLLRLDIPGWLHSATIRIVAMVPALYCVCTSGAEGIYQLLIFMQVMVALVLPSSVIPLFRIASTRPIMGVYKIPPFLEFLALITFTGLVGLKVIFMVEMIFGNSDWVGNLRWNTGVSTSGSFLVLLIAACLSFSLMLWLLATPLKSASSQVDAFGQSWDVKKYVPQESAEVVGDDLTVTRYHREEPVQNQEALLTTSKSVESHSDISNVNFDLNLPENIMKSDREVSLITIDENSSSHLVGNRQEAASLVGSAPSIGNEVEHGNLPSTKTVEIESVSPVEKTVSLDGTIQNSGNLQAEKDDEGDAWEPEEPSKAAPESTHSVMPDGPPSFRSLSGKGDEVANCTGSLSKLAGLGRAARRNLAAVLDEFWGQLYDLHGQPTPEAKAKKLDVLLGVESKHTPLSLKVDTTGKECSVHFSSGVGRGSELMISSTHYDSPKQSRVQNSIGSLYGFQRGSLWSNNMQFLDAGYVQSPGCNVDSGERRYSSLHAVPSSDAGERRYSSLRAVPSSDAGERRYSSLRAVPSFDAGERRYSSLRAAPSSDAWDNQPATVHGYQIASYLNQIAKDRDPTCWNSQVESPLSRSPSLGPTNYGGSLGFVLGQKLQNGITSAQASGFNLAVPRNTLLQPERSYNDVHHSVPPDSGVVSANTKKYHSLPDISGLSVPQRDLFMSDKSAQWDAPIGYGSSVGRTNYEKSMYSNTGSRAGAPLAFNELSPSKSYRENFPVKFGSGSDTRSLWSTQPFEQFGMADKSLTAGIEGLASELNSVAQDATSVVDSEAKLLQSFRHCIFKLLKLEGSDWLFTPSDGADEELIDLVAAREKFLYEAETREINQLGGIGDSQYLSSDRSYGSALRNGEAGFVNVLISSVPQCGDGCIWKADLIVSFGVWCIHRILDLSLMESRPELWGKYTYVLNRLQGVIDLSFSRPRSPMTPCFCLQIPGPRRSSPPVANGMLPPQAKPGRGKCTTAAMVLDLIKDVEMAISSRKGRSGTAAGDVAFPKGKENLASVLKRYKRRLSNKPGSTHEGPISRKVLTQSP